MYQKSQRAKEGTGEHSHNTGPTGRSLIYFTYLRAFEGAVCKKTSFVSSGRTDDTFYSHTEILFASNTHTHTHTHTPSSAWCGYIAIMGKLLLTVISR